MLLTPITRGRLDITQLEPLSDDPSNAPELEVQLTVGEPLPPVMVPVSEMAAAVVVAGGGLIVRARALGGGTTPVCAAYTLRMAVLSPSARVETSFRYGYMTSFGLSEWPKPRACPNSWRATLKTSTWAPTCQLS